MSSITEIVLRDVSRISESFSENITEPSRLLEQISSVLREEEGFFISFERQALPDGVSLSAIDGGNASEKLAGGDLIVAGATLAEGMLSKKIFTEDNYPAEVYSNIIPHTSANDTIEKSIRALLELFVLVDSGTDVRIIDGAYLGNVSNVLYALINRDKKIVNAMLNEIVSDFDNRLEEAFKLVFVNPEATQHNGLIAIPKSDSSTVYVNDHLSSFNLKKHGYTDRMFASRVLLPGEFLKPRNLETNQGLIATLNKTISSEGFYDEIPEKGILKSLVSGKSEALQRLGTRSTEYGMLWTTYFKPSAWDKFGAVLKVEFVHLPNSGMTVLERTKEVVQTVDQDIVDRSILEPWSQYYADRRAKDVSVALNVLKNHLLNQASSTSDAIGLVRGYRT